MDTLKKSSSGGLRDRLYRMGSHFPARPKAAIKCAYYGVTLGRRERSMAILNSIQKSGTNYVRIFISNYLCDLTRSAEGPISFAETHNTFLPNCRDDYLVNPQNYRTPHPIMDSIPLDDFVYGHSSQFLEFCQGRIVFLYRNPLDYIVSLYFYNWKHRPNRSDGGLAANDVIDRALDDRLYIYRYNFMKTLARRRTNVLHMSYESLMTAPRESFATILSWLTIPLDYRSVETALRHSSFDVVRAEEESKGVPIVDRSKFSGQFLRSGKIGQWREQFSDDDLCYLQNKLDRAGISLNEFILE